MRLGLRVFVLLVTAALFAPGTLAQRGDDALLQFARQVGLADRDGFVETVTGLRTSGALPQRYLTKTAAERRGWHAGADLCRAVPGASIGGDRFDNRERALPDAARRTWREADLDFNCGPRGAKRLVWSNDGLYFVTVDHYRTFKRVPQ